MVRGAHGWMMFVLVTGFAAGCGEDDPAAPDPELSRFVGTWDADSLTVAAEPPDTTVANVLDLGSFFITVEASGQYTATLEVLGQANPEIGQLSVSGSTLTLTPTFPAGRPVATATFSFPAEDFLILDGPTEFDFNLDGTDEPAQAHFELKRR